jgi:pre-mRNA-splicing factor CWC26
MGDEADEPTRDSANDEKQKMSSGHTAGLLKGAQFSKELKAIKKKEAAKMTKMGEEKMGKDQETVYRDKKGRRLDMLEEMMKQQRVRDGKEERTAKEEYEWGTGDVQKQQKNKLAEEYAKVAAAPFARHADDADVDAVYKDRMRFDDPMAAYVTNKKVHQSKVANAKPVYKGPAPPPNRFGIRPGYRWDGVDRGSDFERKLAKAHNSKAANRADYAAYSQADL